MDNYEQTLIPIDHIDVDDHVKVAGVLYRITKIERLGGAYQVQCYNVRRPDLTCLLTLETNILVTIWNPK